MAKTAHQLTRKEMKGPDRFQVALSEAGAWLSQRSKVVVLAGVGAAAIAVAAVAASRYHEGKRTSAGGALYQAIEAASQDSDPAKPGGDPQAALAAARKVRGDYPNSRAASTAALLEGQSLLALKKWDEAIAAYRSYLSSAPAGDSLRFAASFGVAQAEEGKGDLQAAVKAYEEAASIEAYRDRATLERARVLAKAGKKDEARKALLEIGKNSPLEPQATAQLARMEMN